MDVFESAESLVDERLVVGIGEGLAGADLSWHRYIVGVLEWCRQYREG
jgi:hypothetical protein